MKIFVVIVTFILGMNNGFALDEPKEDLATRIFVGCTDKSDSKMKDDCLDDAYFRLLGPVERLRTNLQHLSEVLLKTGQPGRSIELRSIVTRHTEAMAYCRLKNEGLKENFKNLVGFESFQGELTACFIMTEIKFIRTAEALNL